MVIRFASEKKWWDVLNRPGFELLAVGVLFYFGLRVLLESRQIQGEPYGENFFQIPVLMASGLLLGSALTVIQHHPRRRMGLVPPAATGAWLTASTFFLTGGKDPSPQLAAVLLGFLGALAGLPLLFNSLASASVERPQPRGCFSIVILVLALPLLGVPLSLAPGMARFLLADCSLVLVLWSWAQFYPHTVELLCELLLAPMYRVRAHGPGQAAIPRQGPVLLIANHSSYFDPFWVGVVVPRRVRPMMTSRFFDLPVVRWLMVSVFQAIRVQATLVRREVPELQEALAVLRQGGCLLVFPEGRLRRSPDQLLQPFGQGVWHLLKELPETPVVILWIEGGWGSFLSYYQGTPGQNKRLDWSRPIDVALSVPRVLPAAVLADQRGTRRYLEQACLECRAYLGLAVPTVGKENGENQAKQENPAAVPGIELHQIVL